MTSGSPEEADAAPGRPSHVMDGAQFGAGVRRLLTRAGHDLRRGTPGEGDNLLVWGHGEEARRGADLAAATGATLVRVGHAFLRMQPAGPSGAAPIGLLLDRRGLHSDASSPSDLEAILSGHPLDDTALMDRARDAIARLQAAHLTAHAPVDPELAPPDPGFVLVIDQPRGHAAIRLGHANADSFAEMLTWARQDHPDAAIRVLRDFGARSGGGQGHFDPATLPPGVAIEDRPVSPVRLFEHARAVYTVTSLMGFEALLAGHRPVTFGVPFYAGWGLTDDRRPVPARRNRRLTRAQLAAAALILYPVWHDLHRDRPGTLEDALGALEAQARAWREDRAGYVAFAVRDWKRPYPTAFFGQQGGALSRVRDVDTAARDGRPVQVWAGRESPRLVEACAQSGRRLLRVGDGVLPLRALGGRPRPPLSLVQDDLGNPHDHRRESRLEHLIASAAALPDTRLARAERLIAAIAGSRRPDDAPPPSSGIEGPFVLVAGQAAGDAALLHDAGEMATAHDLLRTARRLHPQARLVYWAPPAAPTDPSDGAEALADDVARGTDPIALIEGAERMVTISSGLGFEALLRGRPVTVLGAPFYAGWGLTTDFGPVPDRRRARPSLAALVHAVLIAYPRYHDPVTDMPCPPEIAVARLLSDPTLATRPATPLTRFRTALARWMRGQGLP